jgi:hypothetical protein
VIVASIAQAVHALKPASHLARTAAHEARAAGGSVFSVGLMSQAVLMAAPVRITPFETLRLLIANR